MKRLLLSLLVIGLFSSCTVIGCSNSSTAANQQSIENYLDSFSDIIIRAADTSKEVSDLYKTASRLDRSYVIERCLAYGHDFDGYLGEITSLKCPQECDQLRKYGVDAISFCKQEITEFGAYYSTKDVSHLYKSESYYNDAQRVISLAAGEMERLERN